MMRNCLLFCFVLCFAITGYAVNWDPVPESQLSIAKPRLDPNANAETIFWKTWLTDRLLGGEQAQSVTEQYLRIKIFNARGVEEHTTIDLVSSAGDMRISDLRARTIKPDGRIIELENKNIFERTVAKAGREKVKMKAFSFAGVEPGDIIEYQWKEYQDNYFKRYNRLYLQREIPTWSVTYFVKPSEYASSILGFSMNCQTFNAPPASFKETPDKFNMIAYQDMPAFKPENNMPPEDQVRSWILLFYSPGAETDPEKYWTKIGKEIFEGYKEQMRVDGKIKEKAKELTAGLNTAEEKVNKIYEFCLNNIKNIYHHRYGVTAEVRQKLQPNKKPSDTLKQGMGDGEDISMLFAALLNSIEIEARIALLSGRDTSFFSRQFLDTLFLDRRDIAVRINGQWRFYDLAAPYLEEGMLSWQEEGVQALLTDSKEPVFILTPMSGPERSRTTRKATLKLLPDGTLEGTIEEMYTGHAGVDYKMVYDGKTEEERQKDFKETFQSRLSTAEVSEIQFENVTDTEKPFIIRYRVKVPGYAERTGKRMLLQPGFFHRNSQPLFSTSGRKFDIYFDYPWSERDEIMIELPEGLELENAEKPASLPMQKVGEYKMSVGINADKKLIFTRDFRFGDNGSILFPAKAYAQIKQVFDFIYQTDNTAVTLRNALKNE
jgi:transglutaminase-like putative cysteine protease